MTVLLRPFYARPTLRVAKGLLGKRLVRQIGDRPLSGLILETEAYGGAKDSASHAFRGRTPRNSVMFGPAGTAYIYFVYGKHYLLNIVTEEEGIAGAVLLRALAPLQGPGQEESSGRRRIGPTDGPARLCRALSVDGSLNGLDLTEKRLLWVEEGPEVPSHAIHSGPRVGIAYAEPVDILSPRRFWINPSAI
jgi:DNA-3-methyladenine glycosylase